MIYVPALKAKLGELQALKHINEADKDKIVPILEIPPIPWDFIEGKQSKEINEHLSSVAKIIRINWGVNRFYLDFHPSLISYVSSEKNDNLIDIFAAVDDSKDLNFIPIFSLDNSYLHNSNAIKYCQSKNRNYCLRVKFDNFDDIYVENDYITFLQKYNISVEEIDLIIDLDNIVKESSKTVYLALRLIMQTIPELEKWKNVVFIASSFPENLGGMMGNKVSILPRVEWQAWLTLYEKKEKLPRLPIFGDYSIANPEFNEVDPRIINMSAAIKYSSNTEWVIFKGASIRMNGFKQFNALSAELVKSEYYSSENFSEGDKLILNYANPASGTGNPTTWRKIGNNHHFALVLKQIQQLPK